MNTFELTEILSVSLAHRYARPDWSAAQNLAVYGRDSSLEGLGANFDVELTWKTTVPEREPKSALEFVKSLLDHRCLFKEEAQFIKEPSSLENITLFLVRRLKEKSQTFPIDWVSLRIVEAKNLSAFYDFKTSALSLFFKFRFPMQWKDQSGHWGGGEWRANLELSGPLNSETGLLFERPKKWQEISAAMAIFTGRTSQIDSRSGDSIEPLATEVATALSKLNGFKSLSIAPEASQSYRFFG